MIAVSLGIIDRVCMYKRESYQENNPQGCAGWATVLFQAARWPTET